ncbi:ectoine/hydroxyectoine ABC transporter permease subunit EhuC [Ornithinicoccus halotolerans]|uniref:ectoine/hydroxyectoine ABC transporter permease subunit EhuC n=1 Tax=Ornithinicoccus halotolerans TaxID=1748220 RepID=UPI001295DF72|nr:ectoine/hydroxyectoine ABC transporter permease subunit EhuC [Ornithinicoccus halotolerans]
MSDLLDTLAAASPQLWEGTLVTLQLTFGGAALAFLVAVGLGLAALSPWVIVRTLVRVIVELFRGTSLVVQVFFLFYVLPLWGVELAPYTTGILALGLNYGAYGSEVVRGSLTSVPQGQWETTTALSMSWLHKMRRVIWPQAWALMLPGLNNLLIMLVKGTALASFFLMNDLTFVSDQMRRTAGTFTSYGIAMVIYLLIALALSWALRVLEARALRRLGLREPTKGETAKATAEAVA